MGKKDKKNILSIAKNCSHTKSVIIHKKDDKTVLKLSNKTLVKNTVVATSCNLDQDLDQLLSTKFPSSSCVILVKPLIMLDLNGILCIKARRSAKPENGGNYRIHQKTNEQLV